MLKASTLPYALLLSVIITILSSSLILLSYYNRILIKNSEIQNQVILNSQSGLNILLGSDDAIVSNTDQTIDLFDTGKDIALLKRKDWGVLEYISATASIGKFTNTKAAIIGKSLDGLNRVALYLPSYNKPLSLCGKTVVKGKVHLPKAGVKRAYIEGQNYIGNKLIYGTQEVSEKELPKLNSRIENQIKQLLAFQFTETDSVIDWDALETNTISHPFSEKTLVIYSKDKMSISSGNYNGNIIFVSESEIEISNSVKMENCIITAPDIYIQNNFRGVLQAIASNSLEIDKNVTLEYPSSLVVYNSLKSADPINIILNEEVTIFGSVISDVENGSVSIEKDCTIYGQVYATNSISLKGKIQGSVFTNNFSLKTPSSIYQNHLLNAEIDFTKLPVNYIGIDLIQDDSPKKVIQWVQ